MSFTCPLEFSILIVRYSERFTLESKRIQIVLSQIEKSHYLFLKGRLESLFPRYIFHFQFNFLTSNIILHAFWVVLSKTASCILPTLYCIGGFNFAFFSENLYFTQYLSRISFISFSSSFSFFCFPFSPIFLSSASDNLFNSSTLFSNCSAIFSVGSSSTSSKSA